MISRNRRRLGGLVLAVGLVPNAASAQTVARSFDELQRTLKVGQTVFVTDESGRQTKGEVADVSASSLVVLTPDTRTFVEGAVREIRRTDRWWKGALIGLGVGAIPGAAAGLAGCAQYNRPACVTDPIVGALVLGGIGAAIGAVIDASVNKVGKLLYASPRQTPGVTLSPLLGNDRRGVLLSVRF
jgi:hypothetical protein